jgi:hypothetical protein
VPDKKGGSSHLVAVPLEAADRLEVDRATLSHERRFPDARIVLAEERLGDVHGSSLVNKEGPCTKCHHSVLLRMNGPKKEAIVTVAHCSTLHRMIGVTADVC